MKLHSLFFNISLFVLVLIACIIPPILPLILPIEYASDFVSWNFPFQQLCYFLFSLAVYIMCSDLKQFKNKLAHNSKRLFVFYYILTPFVFTFVLLFFNSLIFSYLSTLPVFINKNPVSVELPQTFLHWIFCILNFGFSAFYEEVIYRFYFVEKLNSFFNKKQSKVLFIVFEILGTLFFAFSHFYLGILSVINAALAHLILRLCYKKSGNIYCGFLAHFAYNMISLILL